MWLKAGRTRLLFRTAAARCQETVLKTCNFGIVVLHASMIYIKHLKYADIQANFLTSIKIRT